MALFGLGKRMKNRSFDYIPRYYDEDKENLERRLGAQQSNDPNAVKQRIRSSFQQKYRVDSKVTSSANKASNIRLLLIVVLLIAITLVLLLKYVPALAESLAQ